MIFWNHSDLHWGVRLRGCRKPSQDVFDYSGERRPTEMGRPHPPLQIPMIPVNWVPLDGSSHPLTWRPRCNSASRRGSRWSRWSRCCGRWQEAANTWSHQGRSARWRSRPHQTCHRCWEAWMGGGNMRKDSFCCCWSNTFVQVEKDTWFKSATVIFRIFNNHIPCSWYSWCVRLPHRAVGLRLVWGFGLTCSPGRCQAARPCWREHGARRYHSRQRCSRPAGNRSIAGGKGGGHITVTRVNWGRLTISTKLPLKNRHEVNWR